MPLVLEAEAYPVGERHWAPDWVTGTAFGSQELYWSQACRHPSSVRGNELTGCDGAMRSQMAYDRSVYPSTNR
jgi:hypothetical protein